MSLERQLEILQGEGLKNIAESTLYSLGHSEIGRRVLAAYAFSDSREYQEVDPALSVTTAGITFEHPVSVAAGWDKKGRVIHGLQALGFSGVEVGSITMQPQTGNAKPRLRTFLSDHSVSLNSFGFNSPGAAVVAHNLEANAPYSCPVGVNIGKNKLTSPAHSPTEHASIAEILRPFADYFVFNPSSPNTPKLRMMQARPALSEHLDALMVAAQEVPVFIKLSPDLSYAELDDAISTAVAKRIAGLVLCNTTISKEAKFRYGVVNQPGGISGNDPLYRQKCEEITAYAYESAGDRLSIMGSGGISTAEHAIERMKKGASLTQVMTGIRQFNGRTAALMRRDLTVWCQKEGVVLQDIIGVDTRRGALATGS